MTNIGLDMNKRWHHCKSFASDFKSFQNSFHFNFVNVTRKQNMFPNVFAKSCFMEWSFYIFSKNDVMV